MSKCFTSANEETRNKDYTYLPSTIKTTVFYEKGTNTQLINILNFF